MELKTEQKKSKTELDICVCPICRQKVVSPNKWVRYHVRYTPPIQVLACQFCNHAEFLMRNIPNLTEYDYSQIIARIRKVRNFSLQA